MGIGLKRFVGEVYDDLICTICKGVFEDPIGLTKCEHAFCEPCIMGYLNNIVRKCPIDHLPLDIKTGICPVPRVTRNLLAKLEIVCDYKEHGCRKIVKLENLAVHVADCDYSPDRRATVSKHQQDLNVAEPQLETNKLRSQDQEMAPHGADCDHSPEESAMVTKHQQNLDVTVPQSKTSSVKLCSPGQDMSEHRAECNQKPERKEDITDYSFFPTMKATITKHQQVLDVTIPQLETYSIKLHSQGQELESMKTIIKAWQALEVSASNKYDLTCSYLAEWGSRLSLARVTEWNTLVTLPPPIVQRMVSRTLAETECPGIVLKALMDACVDFNWPKALSTAKSRNLVVNELARLVCRRVPGKQAVIVLPTDNEHMGPDFIRDKGYILIFESGVKKP